MRKKTKMIDEGEMSDIVYKLANCEFKESDECMKLVEEIASLKDKWPIKIRQAVTELINAFKS